MGKCIICDDYADIFNVAGRNLYICDKHRVEMDDYILKDCNNLYRTLNICRQAYMIMAEKAAKDKLKVAVALDYYDDFLNAEEDLREEIGAWLKNYQQSLKSLPAPLDF